MNTIVTEKPFFPFLCSIFQSVQWWFVLTPDVHVSGQYLDFPFAHLVVIRKKWKDIIYVIIINDFSHSSPFIEVLALEIEIECCGKPAGDFESAPLTGSAALCSAIHVSVQDTW